MTKKEFIHKFGETLPTGIDMPENHIKIAFMWYEMGYKLAVDEAKQWIKDNYWTCSSAEEYSEDFVKFMEE